MKIKKLKTRRKEIKNKQFTFLKKGLLLGILVLGTLLIGCGKTNNPLAGKNSMPEETKMQVGGSTFTDVLIQQLNKAKEEIASASQGSFLNKNSQVALINKIEAVISQITQNALQGAMTKIQNDILKLVDGVGTDFIIEPILRTEIFKIVNNINNALTSGKISYWDIHPILVPSIRNMFGPDISPDGNKVLFAANGYWDPSIPRQWSDLMIMNIDGTGVMKLSETDNSGNSFLYSLTYTGDKISFMKPVSLYLPHQILTINSDGTGEQVLATGGWPVITANGDKIFFIKVVNGQTDIYVVNSDDTNLINLTNDNLVESNLDISYNGEKIVYVAESGWDINKVFTMNSDGSGRIEVSNPLEISSYAVISGNGNRIAFSGNLNGRRETFIANTDGSNLTKITGNIPGQGGVAPTMSYDGNIITLTGGYIPGGPPLVCDSIWIIEYPNVDTPIKITENSGDTFCTASHKQDISADGKKIVFMQATADGDKIFLAEKIEVTQ